MSGSPNSTSTVGAVLTVRPETGNFSFSTTVKNHNKALKGLVYYGDKKNCIGLGLKGKNIEVWQVKNGEKIILKSLPITHKQPLSLKIKVTNGYKCQFYWGKLTDNYEEIFFNLCNGGCSRSVFCFCTGSNR